ncbi:hypothetical protein BV25DRAFT_1843114 [Artomyces pyxidatus]|uniref:Uncharacterized protein n=1 Tax=Artomyces pyxidatus TaxID=48021 RepID=A0ACB8SFB5_9AGAM|nr:hypothetical protein BV25DRAFT_1843114 [Artomyces pyxidatus]
MRYLDTEGISVGTPANVPSEHASSTPNARITEAAQAAALDPDRQSVTWPSVRARPNLAGLFTIALSLLFHRAFFVDAGLLFAKRQKVPVGEDINLRNSAVYILGTLYSAWNRRAADGFELGCVEQDGAHDMFAKPFVVDLLCDMFIGFRRACRDRWVSLVYTVKLDPFGLKLGWENRWDIAVNASESLEGYSFITKEQLGVRSSSTSLTIVGPHPDFGSPRVLTVCKDVFFVNRHIVNMDPLVVAFDRSKTILCEDIICRFAGTYEGYATAVPNSMIAITSAIAAVMLDNVSTFHANYSPTQPSRDLSPNLFTPEKIRVRFEVILRRINAFLSVPLNSISNDIYRYAVAEMMHGGDVSWSRTQSAQYFLPAPESRCFSLDRKRHDLARILSFSRGEMRDRRYKCGAERKGALRTTTSEGHAAPDEEGSFCLKRSFRHVSQYRLSDTPWMENAGIQQISPQQQQRITQRHEGLVPKDAVVEQRPVYIDCHTFNVAGTPYPALSVFRVTYPTFIRKVNPF